MATKPSQSPEGDPDLCAEQSVPTLVDLVFYAPIGFALAAASKYRKQAVVARFIGKMVVDQQKRRRRSTVVVVETEAFEAEVATAEPVNAEVGNADSDAPVVARLAVEDLPIDGYDTLPTRSILMLLDGLATAELDRIEAYEKTNRQRATVLHRLAQLLNTS